MNKIQIIMKKTLVDSFSIKKTTIYLLFMLITSYLFAFAVSSNRISSLLFLDQQATLVSNYFLIGFMWTVGIPYLLYLIVLSAEAISKEIGSGTFLLIFSRPVKRLDILLGKFSGIFIYLMILNAYILFLLPSLAGLFYGLGNSLVYSLYKVSLVLFLYSIFITIFIMALSFILSTKFRKATTTSVVLFIVVLGIFFTPFLITNMTGEDAGYNPGYSFGLLGINLLEGTGLDLIPGTKSQFGSFTGVYSNTRDNPIVNYPYDLLEPTKLNIIPPSLNLLLIILLSVVMFYISYLFLRKKEIY